MFDMVNRAIFLVGIFYLTIYTCYCQSAKVLVQNSPLSNSANPLIEIKWYSQEFVYPKGTNIYRRAKGDLAWIKLNPSAIVIQKTVPADWARQDEDLEAFVGMANDIAIAQKNSFLLLNLFAKSFQSKFFSTLIGIQFDDNKINWGSVYEYRITKIERNQEIELGLSPPIQSGPYLAAKPVEQFTAKADKRTVKLNWRPDEDRFYAVNVYRNTNNDTLWRKVNQNPVMLSEAKGNPPASDALYQDTNLKEGITYYYRITGLDFFGGESTPTEKAEISIGDITQPPPPVNISGKIDNNKNIIISWSAPLSTDISGFNIYRSSKSDGPFLKINEAVIAKSDSSYSSTLPPPGFYYFYITSIDLAGNEGASERTMLEVKDILPPSTPLHVIAKPDTGKIILSWSRSPEPDVSGYYVYRSIRDNEKNAFVLINAEPIRDSVYIQILAKNASNKFSFQIVAVDSAYNKSAPSEIVSTRMPDVIPPLKPIIKNINLKGDSVLISWVTNPDGDLAGYHLFRCPNLNSTKTKVNTQSISATEKMFTDTTHTEGKVYYELQAFDESGNLSNFSDPFPIEIQAKFNFKFEKVSGKFYKARRSTKITWLGSAPAKHLQGYVVFRKSEKELTWKSMTGLFNDGSFEDKMVEPKTKYLYQVRAYSSLGEVVLSDEIGVKSGR